MPERVGFATKPALATAMIEDALDAGVPAKWVAGDEVYGQDPTLARRLKARGLGYVLAISTTRRLPIDARTSPTASRTAADLPRRSWQRRSAGAGAHDPREYDWAWVQLHPRVAVAPGSALRRGGRDGQPAASPGWDAQVTDAEASAAASGACWWLLVRRHPRTKEMAYYLGAPPACGGGYAPTPVALAELVAVAGRRWIIEEAFQASKGLTGLDEHQVRRWRSWRRWTLLVMAAHAVLAVATATARHHEAGAAGREGLIPLTCAEIRTLVTADARHRVEDGFVLAWSRWRRRHQYRARLSHYARRNTSP